MGCPSCCSNGREHHEDANAEAVTTFLDDVRDANGFSAEASADCVYQIDFGGMDLPTAASGSEADISEDMTEEVSVVTNSTSFGSRSNSFMIDEELSMSRGTSHSARSFLSLKRVEDGHLSRESSPSVRGLLSVKRGSRETLLGAS